MKLAMKSWLSSSPAEWRWTLQRLQGVLAAPGTKHSSRKTYFSYSLPKRETQTSIIMGTRAGFWYPVALPWDQRFCVLFSHIQKGKMHMSCFKKPQTNKKPRPLSVHAQQTARDQSETPPGFGVGAASSCLSVLYHYISDTAGPASESIKKALVRVY